MTTPGPTLEERVTILETRLDTVLPTLATKEDLARLEGKMDAMDERLSGKMEAMDERLGGRIDAMGHRLLIRFTGVMAALVAIAVAAARFL